ncbi:MAG: class I SAM-dependent methyltransferase [Acidobacteria bacterium]|nr:class I SAM-dependent methyltransferase [Acidobacteriota bacterium]
MHSVSNLIVETYSRLADQYDDQSNDRSCWGQATQKAIASIRLQEEYRDVLDMGCGTGKALAYFASTAPPHRRFVGVDPAVNMRLYAQERTRAFSNVEVRDGCFESIPLDAQSVDYLYSIFAFHWTTDLEASVREISRVLRKGSEMDMFFIGRDNGREFIQKTTPIFLKYMGPALLLNSARMRKQLTKDAAFRLFSKSFDGSRISIEESHDTYYDTLEGHWGWWVRIEGHFVQIPPAKKQACNAEVQQALLSLAEPEGIPYTIHQLHVRLRRA